LHHGDPFNRLLVAQAWPKTCVSSRQTASSRSTVRRCWQRRT